MDRDATLILQVPFFPRLDVVFAPVTMTTLDFISGSFENGV